MKTKSNPLPAATPSARRLTGTEKQRVIEQQRDRWSRLASTFEDQSLTTLATERMLEADLTPADADSDAWLAAAQSVYNRRANRANRAYNGRSW